MDPDVTVSVAVESGRDVYVDLDEALGSPQVGGRCRGIKSTYHWLPFVSAIRATNCCVNLSIENLRQAGSFGSATLVSICSESYPPKC